MHSPIDTHGKKVAHSFDVASKRAASGHLGDECRFQLKETGPDVTLRYERPGGLSARATRYVTEINVHGLADDPTLVDEPAALAGDRLDTGVVSYHYGQAMAAPGEFDEQATAVTALLHRRSRKRPHAKPKPTADALPVRYHVDVQET